MGVMILEGRKINSDRGVAAALYCSTTGMALECHLFDDAEQAQRFLDWLQVDPRKLNVVELADKYSAFCAHDLATEAERDVAHPCNVRKLLLVHSCGGDC